MSERVPAGGPYRAAVGLHDSLSLEHLSEVRRLLSTYCGAGGVYCCRLLEILQEVSPLVARARLESLAGEERYEGLDRGILALYERLLEFYSKYISGMLLGYGEDVIVRVTSVIEEDGVLLYPGEYVRLPPERAAALYVAGKVVPGEATAIKVGRECKSGGGAERGEVPEKD